jgi:hypothetical protein
LGSLRKSPSFAGITMYLTTKYVKKMEATVIERGNRTVTVEASVVVVKK